MFPREQAKVGHRRKTRHLPPTPVSESEIDPVAAPENRKNLQIDLQRRL
jgi:hypothetical protein